MNVDVGLAPGADINPGGYEGWAVTQLRDLGVNLTPLAAGEALLTQLQKQLETSHG